MTKTKQIFRITLVGLFFLIINYSFIFFPIPVPSNNLDNPLNLKNKDYYISIFDKKDQKVLGKVYKKYDKGDKLMTKYDKYLKKSEELGRYLNVPMNDKKKKKYQKKISIAETNAAKTGLKAMFVFVEANKIVREIYVKNLKKFSPDSSNAKIIHILNSKSKSLFDTVAIIRKNAENLDIEQKFDKYYQADNLELYAISLQEKMFYVFKNDTSEIKKIRAEYCSDEVVAVVVKTKTSLYDADNDPNIYKSKLDTLIVLTKLSDSYKSILDKNKFKQNTAFVYNNRADSLFEISENIKKEAATKGFMERKDLIANANMNENEAYYYSLKTTQTYLETNKSQFLIFDANYSKFTPADSTAEYKKYVAYKNDAKKYYDQSNKIEATAKKETDNSKKNVNYLVANDLILTALQYQENAYSVYFNLPEEEVISFYNFEKAKIPNIVTVKTDTAKVVSPKEDDKIIAKIDGDDKTTTKKTNTKTTTNTTINTTTKTTTKATTNTNNKFEYESTWQYSAKNPTPKKVLKKDGVIFRVQVATVKNPLSISKFVRLLPITYDKFKNNNKERYMVGEYKTSEAADLALMEVKSMGYSDALIVGYVNGKRTTYSSAKAKLKKTAGYDNIVKAEKSVILGEDCVLNNNKVVADNSQNKPKETKKEVPTTATTTTKKKNNFVNSKDITQTKYLLYVIQLGTYLTPKTSEQLKNLSTIYETKTKKGMYRYMVGPYYSLSDAKNQIERVQKLGFSGAYVTAFNNGVEIDVTKASKIETNVKAANIISFKVQIGAFVSYLSDKELESKFGKIKQNYSISTQIVNKLVVYSVGDYSSYSEVKSLQTRMQNLGYSDCFIIAFKGQNKISLADARK